MAILTSPVNNAVFTKGGVSRTGAQGVSPIRGGGFGYDVAADKDMVNSDSLKKVRGELDQFMGLIDTTYKQLIATGRADAAASLRDMGDRMKRMANTRGVNSEQIARQMFDITNQLNTQTSSNEARILAQKLAVITETLSKKADVDTRIFSQGLQTANFREQVLGNMEKNAAPGVAAPRPTFAQPLGYQRQANTSSPIMSTMQADQRVRMDQAGEDVASQQRIASFLDEKERANSRGNPFYQTQSPTNTWAQGGLAVTQAKMGITPGLFQSGPPLARPPVPASPLAAQKPGVIPVGWIPGTASPTSPYLRK